MQFKTENIKAVWFDMDGTLVDNFAGIHANINHAISQLGYAPIPMDVVLGTIGGSMEVTLGKLGVKEGDIPKATQLQHEHFQSNKTKYVKLLPGAEWLLAGLQQQGKVCAVLTNNRGINARAFMAHFKLTGYFHTIFGKYDMDETTCKPLPAFNQYLMQQTGIHTSEAIVMVGDGPYDFGAAEASGLHALGVATGSHSFEYLQANAPQAPAVASDTRVYKNLYALGAEAFGLTLPEGIDVHMEYSVLAQHSN